MVNFLPEDKVNVFFNEGALHDLTVLRPPSIISNRYYPEYHLVDEKTNKQYIVQQFNYIEKI